MLARRSPCTQTSTYTFVSTPSAGFRSSGRHQYVGRTQDVEISLSNTEIPVLWELLQHKSLQTRDRLNVQQKGANPTLTNIQVIFALFRLVGYY